MRLSLRLPRLHLRGSDTPPKQERKTILLVLKNNSSIPEWVRKGEPHFMEELQEPSDETVGINRFLQQFGITPRQLMEAVPGFLVSNQGDRGLDSPQWKGFSGTHSTKHEFTDGVIQAFANLTGCQIELYELNWLSGDVEPKYYGSFNPK